MEIAVVSESNTLNDKFLPMIDRILYEKKIRKLNLYTQVMSLLETEQLPVNENYLFIVDIRKEKTIGAIRILEQIKERFPRCNLVLLVDSSIDILRVINIIGNVNGVINIVNGWQEQLTDILVTLERKMQQLCKGILILHYNMDMLIPYDDIYYIETIKSTHCCLIWHKNGKEKIRANIKNLIEQLDSRFEIVHASTIANLSLVKKIDQKNRCLYFAEGVSCGYSNASRKKIREKMKELV